MISGSENETKDVENDVLVENVSPSSKAIIKDIMFSPTPPGSALDTHESAEEVFAAKDLDFAIDDEGIFIFHTKKINYFLLSTWSDIRSELGNEMLYDSETNYLFNFTKVSQSKISTKM